MSATVKLSYVVQMYQALGMDISPCKMYVLLNSPYKMYALLNSPVKCMRYLIRHVKCMGYLIRHVIYRFSHG